jgi:putative ubiquitin-RnfH superfamily antitoxin RatB of RatAB toxin-antitoxin module
VNVTVVWAAPGVADVVPVVLDAGATVADAVAQSRLADDYGLVLTRLAVAIFGKRVAWDSPVADGDRVEITRPLVSDPKEARKRRAQETTRPTMVQKAKP